MIAVCTFQGTETEKQNQIPQHIFIRHLHNFIHVTSMISILSIVDKIDNVRQQLRTHKNIELTSTRSHFYRRIFD